MKTAYSLLATVLLAASLSACNSQAVKPESTAKVELNNNDYYEVSHDGRTYVFDDAGVFKEFLAVGETPFRQTRIGAGPHGETLVFGLHKHDKKKSSGIAAIDMYEGRLEGAAEGFYGEIRSEGRIYVFDNWADLKGFKAVGEAVFRYTDIGAGPAGETVVYVLNKQTKKSRPDALMARFKALHSMG